MDLPGTTPSSAAVVHKKGKILGPRNLTIHCQAWVPRQPPQAALLVIHGLKEHSGRYLSLVDHFAPLGYAVYSCDLPGHGQSGGTRAYVESFSEYLQTIEIYREQVGEWQPDLPVFLYGHSMGGLISVLHLINHQRPYRGAVISAPLFSIPENQPDWMISVGKILSRLAPKLGILHIETKNLSRLPQVVEGYREDPLVYGGKVTARLGAEMVYAIQAAQAQAHKVHLPLLILQGEEDRIVDPQGAKELYTAITSEDKTIQRYAGCYHELHHEPEEDRQQVFQDLERWLRDHI